ncbi:methyltransferase-domain-containing protein [Tricladium varicosporioides]|nr:methyltransferase-domain-containing protein [Hymenoscyphus varicosporioides]
MFAVPGWSVSSSALKTQVSESAKFVKKTNGPDESIETSKPNKKRKRSGNKNKDHDVDTSNVADLYETIIEKKDKIKSKFSVEKRYKISNESGEEETWEGFSEREQEPEKKKKEKTLKEKRREKKKVKLEAVEAKETCEDAPPSKAIASSKPQLLPKTTPQLTPMQAKMREKLISARFRHLNQTLYTTPSSKSLSLFGDSPEMFSEYHEGFRKQVEVWPENPVNGYILSIRSRGKVRGPARNFKGEGENGAALPRTEGTCVIADLGCGDAALSTALQKDSKKLKLQINSFDLYSPHPLVTRADIADLPLADNSTDVAIFCLALMGTNWIDFIEEAYRILRWKGELWVAEIKSRFGRVGGGKGGVVSHSVGNRQKKMPIQSQYKKSKQQSADETAAHEDATLAVEVDGNDTLPQQTDVSAFVEVLRKRGFVLKVENGAPAIDLSNKMFVRMQFLKSTTPIKGKCVPIPKGMEEKGLETWKRKPQKKLLEGDEEVAVSSEAAVLKPCVYKLR